MVSLGHERDTRRRGGTPTDQRRPDDLAGGRRAVGGTSTAPGGRQAAQEAGRPRHDDRPIFDGLIWLGPHRRAVGGLPREFGPKSTVHDRLQEWVEYGCLERAWARLLAQYDDEIGLDWAWQAADGCIVKAPLGKKGGAGEAEATGAQPHRPRQMRHQAPPADRGAGHPARHRAHRGQPHRHEEAGRPARRDAGGSAPAGGRGGAAPLPGPGLRLRRLPRRRDGARLHPAHPPAARRPPPAAAARRPGPPPRPPLGGRGRATAGSTASAACSSAGRRRPPTTSASSNSPPSSSSTASSAMPAHFPDRLLARTNWTSNWPVISGCRHDSPGLRRHGNRCGEVTSGRQETCSSGRA